MCEICIDKTLTRATPEGVFKAWGLKEGWLKQNETVTFQHDVGTPTQHVQEWNEVFREVESFTNLTFVKGSSWHTSILRISYESDQSWSYVGSDNYSVNSSQATTNIGWFGKGTKRHELGHFIGLGHEHQNPTNPIKWNKPYVYEVMGQSPNFWTKEQVDWNFFKLYNKNLTVGTVSDPKSIMMYAIPTEFTLDGYYTTSNEEFSEMDKKFLSAIYPKKQMAEETQYLAIKTFIEMYMNNNPRILKRLPSKNLKSVAKYLKIKYRNKSQAASEIINKLKV